MTLQNIVTSQEYFFKLSLACHFLLAPKVERVSKFDCSYFFSSLTLPAKFGERSNRKKKSTYALQEVLYLFFLARHRLYQGCQTR